MDNKTKFAAVQNGTILDIFDSHSEAVDRVRAEIKHDFLSILFKRKLRKLLKKTDQIALHRYFVLSICESEEVTQ